MMESVANLKKKSKKGATTENTAFQQLFLLVGMHLFKVRVEGAASRMKEEKKSVSHGYVRLLPKAPEELLDVLKDLQSCMEKAQEKKSKKKKKQKGFLENQKNTLLVEGKNSFLLMQMFSLFLLILCSC